ncbi:winged helix-turn-helix domain-containing protein [Actinoplanes sp. TBRC 11911]|uniref:winged helix-turn-helix domain-containing protein n=1 Tax=Actinoplanes sp. TBRC 11911 TaxID=2729386 RepID=UPI00145D5B15|nr:crosslink repair DNA glycosylase YcaQ family protein [Actinoplanes sp. TBRC 11911]NMO57444.1 winged helix-turn-helix domain-containing protein [Actinoplanes sp. TBRC 11911]
MALPDSLSAAQARRVTLAAQGFTDAKPGGATDMRHLRRVLRRLHLIQMDSVNVLQRAHFMPLYSRLGPYPVDLLERAAYRKPRELFEFWGHEASLITTDLQPLFRWRMSRAADFAWGSMVRISREQPELIAWVLDEVRGRGPITAAEIEHDAPRRKDHWGWNWSVVKQALEWLFYTGQVTAAERTTSFARRYDVPERVLPSAVLNAPTPPFEDALRALVELSARALGVAAERELRDYFRLPVAGFKQAVAELVDDKVLIPVTVAGWRPVAYLHHEARLPRRVQAATLVSPFDPLIWERERTERLFDLAYRIEIYVPAPKRLWGYYVLPFLLGDRFAARVDLKADRKAGELQIPAAYLEPAADQDETAGALATELHRLAGWLGLESVAPPVRGDLAGPLTAALKGVL